MTALFCSIYVRTKSSHISDRNVFEKIIPIQRRRKYIFVALASTIFCVLLLTVQPLLAVYYEREIPPEYEYQTTLIFPGNVRAVGWENPDATYSQDAQQDSLYSFFDERNSAKVTQFVSDESVQPDSNQVDDQSSDADSSQSFTDETTTSDVSESQSVVDEPQSTDEPIEQQASEVSEPVQEQINDVEEPATESTEPAAEPTSEQTSFLFKVVNDVYDFAVGVLTESTEDSIASTNVSEIVQVVDEPISDVVSDQAETLPQSETTDGEILPLESTNVVIGDETTPQETIPADTDGVSGQEQVVSTCDNGSCNEHVLEFSDFSVGDGFDSQQITNMQFRMSLAARPGSKDFTMHDKIRIEYLHYDYWMDGGEIEITEEISNAINGGFFLFGFPLYSEWDEMKRIKVRLTYESNNEHLADIYVDSVWLEVESIDNNAFNEPEPLFASEATTKGDRPELRRGTPDGYTFNFKSPRSEFSFDERPQFKFDISRPEIKKGIISRIGSGIKSFFGFKTVEDSEGNKMRVRVANDEFREVAHITEENGEYVVDIEKPRQFKPGKHIITLEVTDRGQTFFIDQEFSWGVLALNTDKSMYLEGEESYLQMGVLDNRGHTLCDAALSLEITDPQGVIQYLNTDNGTINYGDECAGDTFTTSPDYDALYTFTSGVGTYTMKLTATTKNGIHTITDKVEVRESVAFDIVRTGPTRIYPPELYPVTLTVTAREDYVGQIIEYVPASFQVYDTPSSPSFTTHEVGDAKQLIWDVSLVAGETFDLEYRFDAPDISPEFYLLGPLEIGGFKEIREWQIASDAPDLAVIVQSVMGTPTSATSYSATFGSAPAAGNTIIMVATHRDGASAFNTPASYFTQAVLSNATVEIDSGIWYAASNPATTTYSITKTGGNQTGVVYLMEVAGLDTSSPLNVTASSDQTSSNSLTASTSVTATSTQYGFAVAGITFADNDFAVPTSASWSSGSTAAYTQRSTVNWATGNDGTFSVATANINVAAPQRATQTLTVGGTEQRNGVIAVFKLEPQSATVGARGNQTAQLKINTTNNYVGGAFTFLPSTGYATVTSVTVTETGTTNAANDLSNIRMYYELDSVAPYDCASATYDGTEARYGATSTAFSSANGTSTFTGTVRIATTSMMCGYVVLNVDSSATPGHTLELQISTPNTQVLMSEGSTSPGSAVAISDTTTLVVGFVPTTPVLTNVPAFPYMRSTSTQPTFGGFVSTDPDGDVLQYEFSIDDDPLFGSPATTTNSSNYPSDAGWASATFAAGATTTYRIQQALTPGETYWWRVRARDPFNTNTWTAYTPARSITIASALPVPEWLQTNGYQFATGTTLTNGTSTVDDKVTITDLDNTVTLLDAWTTGNTKTISAGSNRMLIVSIISEDSGTSVNVNTVTYGGRLLTEITDQQIGTGYSNGMWVGYLNDVGIASSTSNTIAATWTGGTPDGGIQYASAVFEGVDQSSPVRAFSPNALTAGTNITPAASISVVDGDTMFYVTETATGLTHTAATGYTEGIEQDTGGVGFVNATAHKFITADGSEFPEAVWSGAGNRLLMVAAALRPASAQATIMSNEVDFDWVSGQTDWGEITWHVTEPVGSQTRLQVYYGTSTSCSTLVPNAALSGNSVGFAATSSPLRISSLSTSTSLYNKICLKMTLSEGAGTTSPTLNDWTVSWDLSPIYSQTAYRWFGNATSTTPTDTWPEGTTGSELSENSPIVSGDPTKYGDVLRLRIGLTASSVSATGDSFTLQYAPGDVCTAATEWTDVAAISSTTALWRGYNNAGISDGATLASSTLGSTDVFESYEEENSSATMPNTIAVGQQGEWDWVLENRATEGASYCFRMITADGNPLTTYTQYPLLVTNNAPEILSLESPFDNEKVASSSPWFEFVGVDAEGNSVDYQIQIDDDADYSSKIIDTDSEVNLLHFSNIANPGDKTPFNESEVIRYKIPTTLASGTTYWWKVRVKDSSGSTQYGAWSASQSFTVAPGTAITTWFQTTEEQFDTDTLVGTDATASDNVTFASGSTTGTTTSSSIDFDDVTIGNAWGTFSFTETGAANTILYHIEYFDGASWILIPDAALAGNAAGYDVSPVNLIDLDTGTYNEIRIRANFISGSPTIENWTVTWGERVSVPTHLLLFDNEKVGTTTPTFTFFTTDPDGDNLEYQFSWSTDNTFTTGTTTVNSSSSPGFLNVSNGLDVKPFTSGDTISYKVQSALTNNTTYWWRVRAKDPEAGNNYSFWSDPWSFTIDTNATTSTWFQTTEEQFETDTMVSLVASTSDSVSTVPAGVTTYTFAGITNPSATHIARTFEVDVDDPTDPPTVNEIDTITTNGTVAGAPNLRTAIAGYAIDSEASNAQYTALSTSNNTRWTTADPGNTDQAIIWSSFLINEDPADITQIEVQVEGYQGGAPAGTDKAWFGIWRPGSTTPYWQNLEALQTTSDNVFNGTITTNINQYFDGNNRLHLIFFNEDDSDPIIVDYVEVKITTATADSGTITSTPIDFDDGSGPAWGQLIWNDTEGLGSITYTLEYLTLAGTWDTIPNAALSGNESGFTTSPITLTGLNTTIYNEIRVVADLNCVLLSCPTLHDWTIKWSPGFSVSGTAYEYNGTSSTTAGTVAVAVNGVLTGKTGSILANGTWTIDNVTYFPGDVVTVFVNNVADVDEAVAVTTYDGTPNITGMRLQKRHLTLGSDDGATITNANIGAYDYTNDEDLFLSVDGSNDLLLCADVGCGDAGIVVRSGNTYSPGTGADVRTHDFRNDGTFIAGANTIRVSGSWDNNATTTMTGSTVTFTATSTSETVDSTGALSAEFNTVIFGETSTGTATWTLGSVLDVHGALSVLYGTLARSTYEVFIEGNLTIGATGFWTGIGSTTFDGLNPTTWTDNNATKQNIGKVVVDGTSKILILNSNVIMQSMYIGVNDTFDLSATGYTASVYRNWINTGTFNAPTGTVSFIATTTNMTITAGGDAFHNLTFNGGNGSWFFSEADLLVNSNFTIATGSVTLPTGTTTVSGSFVNSGGAFGNNAGTVLFNGAGTKIITQSGTAFANTFWNLRFEGSGSWSFTEANATTSNDFTIAQGTVTFPSANLSIGGSFTQTGGSFVHNSATVKFTSSNPETIDVSGSSFNSLSFTGSGSWSFVDASVTALGSVWVTGGTLTLPTGTFSIGGSFGNWATVNNSNGTVHFNSTDGTETIRFGNSSLYNVLLSGVGGIWTVTDHATTTNNFTLLTSTSFTLAANQTLAVGGAFSNYLGGASTTWAVGSVLSLENGAYSINTKNDVGDAYATLRVKANTDIQMWHSTSTVYDVSGTGSLYSQDHNGVDGELYIFGAYERTSGTEYWSYATDFDGASVSRQVDVKFANGASATFSGSTVEILGISTATTTVARQVDGLYGISLSNSVLNAQYYDMQHLNISGLRLLASTTVTSLANGVFSVDAVGGSAITVSESVIDSNQALQIFNVRFNTSVGTSSGLTTGNGDNTFLFFDDFNDSSINTSKWTADVQLGTISETGGYLRAGGGITSGNYGFVSLGSEIAYDDFLNNSVVWRARNATDGIGELAFRGDYGTSRGYKARFDARVGANGQGFLEPPYSGWAFSVGAGCGSDSDEPLANQWYNYEVTASSTNFIMYRDGALKRNCTDTSYALPGEIALQNHYGSYTDYDWVAVRPFVTPSPTSTSWGAEETVRTGLFREQHTVTGSTVGAQTGYVLPIVVNFATGTDSGASMYCNGLCNGDFSDIRFADANGAPFSYWRDESFTASSSATFWVKFDNIPVSPGTTTVYAYYGDVQGSNVTQNDATPSYYWWFRESSGSIEGEYFDNDTGDPGSIRWDDSSLTIAVSGTVYSDDGVTPMGSPTCNGSTANVTIAVNSTVSTSTHCSPVDGTYHFNQVAIVGDVSLTTYLNTNGGKQGVVVTKTPTVDITNHNIYANRVITKHEDVLPLTISDMVKFDASDDSDIRFIAATGTTNSLVLQHNTELHIASSTTFAPGGSITIYGNASSTAQDGSLHIDDNATLEGYATSTITLAGSFTMDVGASFIPASTTVLMNATTTGKTITTITGQEITFNTLQFSGLGGGWNLNGDLRALGTIEVATGTVTGTKNITLQNGSFSGNGVVSLGAGTTTLMRTNTFGGTTPWTLGNLVLGDGSVTGTTTPAGSATTTILGKLTIGTAHYLNAQSSKWDLRGTGTVFVENGTFIEGASTVRYSGTNATNVLGTSYYNLSLDAFGGSPTYTGTGIGIMVLNDLVVGGASTTTFTLDTVDPVLDVDGSVNVQSNGTFVASASALTTVGGSWNNDGVFTGNNGLITFNGSGTRTIAAGTSWFSNVTINGIGDFTMTENATATGAFVLTSANDFTVSSGSSLAVGGTFTNSLTNADTNWTGSTLFLYGGGNYTINASTTADQYNILSIGTGTQIRMWNSVASTVTTNTSASLYSQDHNDQTGDLYIYGAYTKTSGTDYWNYNTDFDGSILGVPRTADVYIANGSSVLYTGGGLAVVGGEGATTTVQNQGSGSYSFRIGGNASTTWSYYKVRNTDIGGLTFSGTPNVVTLSHGDYEVSQNNGSAITVGGSAIQVRTFVSNYFGTSGASPAYNVTATGTTMNSWKFTNHGGAIAGEAYDVDPGANGGDPGYIVWDNSSTSISVSGTVYSGEGAGISTACDGSNTLRLVVEGATQYTTSCDGNGLGGGTGAYTFTGVSFNIGESFIVYIDGQSEKAASVSEDVVSTVNGFDLYENRVIVRHEGVDPLSIADMSVWDSSDDADIPFTALDDSPDTLTLPANRKLIVWNGKEFEPNGNVTVTGGGAGAAYDGTLELYPSALFDAAGTESHTIGGSLISGAGASIDSAQSTFTFTTTGAARTIETNEYPLYNLTVNGTGSWSVTNAALEIGNDFTITQGSITLPTGTTTITGSFQNTGGTFTQNSGHMNFTSSGVENVRPGSSSFGSTTFNGAGTWTYVGTNATSTGDFEILQGTVIAPSGVLSVGGNFNNSGTFTHSSGVLRMTSGRSSSTIMLHGSDLGSLTIAGSGNFYMTDTNAALMGTLSLGAGNLTLASGTVSVAGSFLSTGGTFSHASGTVLFNSSDTGESINPGSSVFNTVSIAAPTGGYTLTGSATSTGNFSLTSASTFTAQSGVVLSVGGVFTNLVGGSATEWSGSRIKLWGGVPYTINTKAAGADTYNIIALSNNTDVRMWNSNATTSVTDTLSSMYSQDHANINGELYIYGNYTRTTGDDYWSYATDFDGTSLFGTERPVTVRIAGGATTTFFGGTLEILGGSAGTTTITNQGSGTYSWNMFGGTLDAINYAVRNTDINGLVLSGTTTITSIANGDLELAVSGGALITVSSTTLNYNASMVITGMRFATTSAITGVNVAVVGSTPSAWTFTSHRGNLDGEYFDDDGVDNCGSLRWDDSSCLLTQQSAYRWRHDDGGESVPDSEWYDASWTKRKRVSVNNTDPTTYTNAVVEVTVPYSTGMQPDFDDIRFTDASGITTLDFTREIYTEATEATVWVKIPTLTASAVTEIYMYYGHGTAPYGGVGTTTFLAYDDFDDGSLSEYVGDTTLFTTGAGFAYQGGYGIGAVDPEDVTIDGLYRTDSQATTSQGQTIRFFQYVDTSTGGDETCTLFGVQAAQENYGVCLVQFGVDRVSIAKDVFNTDTYAASILASTTVTYTTGWYEIEIDWGVDDSIAVSVFKDDVLVATTSASNGDYTTGGIGFTYWFQNGSWDMYTSRPTLTTEPTISFGSVQEDGGASWMAAPNTKASNVEVGHIVRPRFVIENTGLQVTDAYTLEYAPKGASPSCEAVGAGAYNPVPPQATCVSSAAPLCMQNTSYFANYNPTTDVLGGNGIFTSGETIEDSTNITQSLVIESNEYTEVEYAITPTSNASDSNYCLRVSDNGTDIDSYTKVAELQLLFVPNVTVFSINGGNNIILLPGGTTTIYATGTVTDLNGYGDLDLNRATTTMYRSGVTDACTADNNNCYISTGPSKCSFNNCNAGTNSCDISCYADFYYHADATDLNSPYDGQTWRATLSISDMGGSIATGSAPSIDLGTVRAISVDSSIDYGALEVLTNTEWYNATTTIQNIGNDSLDVSLEGTDLTDGNTSYIPVTKQKFATSTFNYGGCAESVCDTLSSTTPITVPLDLAKPASTTPAIIDQLFWGIAIPFGVAGTPHHGTNIFYAVGD